MKKSRFTDEQIINFPKQAEGGVPINSTVLKTCLFSILSQSLQLLQEVCGGQEPGIAV